MSASACAACRTNETAIFVEEHLDPIGRKRYRVLECRACGVVYSEPREAVSAEWYEKSAPLRLEEFASRPERDWRFGLFLSEALTPGRILDVGCGDGGFLRLAQAAGWAVCGFDYDARVVAAARAAGLADVTAAEFSAFCRGRAAGEFDAVTLFDMLEHAPEPALFLAEIKRLLKPGGRVALSMPNARRPQPWGSADYDYPPHHFTRWSPEALRGFLEREGFALERLEADRLTLHYLLEQIFFFGVMRGLLPWAKLILFGRGAGSRTITELYAERAASGRARGGLADKLLRHRLVGFFKSGIRLFLYPIAAALWAYYRLGRERCGEHMYALARLVV